MTSERVWLGFLITGIVAVAVGMAAGGPAQIVIALVLGAAPAITAQIALRRQPESAQLPWRLFVWAGAGFIVAQVLRQGLVAMDLAPSFPSPADGVLATSYVLLFLAVYFFGSIRSGNRNAPAQVDGLIVAVAASTVVWMVVLAPYITDASVPWPDRAINGLFSFLTTITLAATTRLAVSPGARTTSYYLLAAAIATLFLNDVLVTLSTVAGNTARSSIVFLPLVGTLFGAAALNPDSPRLLEPPSDRVTMLTRNRIALLGGALLIVPGLIVWSLVVGRPLELKVLAVGSALLTVLVLIRFRMLVRTQEQLNEVQRILREANAALATSSSRHAMYRAALRAVLRLVGDTDDLRVSIAQIVNGDLRVLDAMGVDAERAIGVAVPTDQLPVELRVAIDEHRSVAVDRTAPIDLADPAGAHRAAVLLIGFPSQSDQAGGLVLSSERPLPPEVRHNVETLASTVSLALESAILTENLLRRRSERRFRALVEHSSDVVLVVDRDLHVTFASPATQHLLGMPEATVLGSHPARLVHPEDWPTVAHLLTDHRGVNGSAAGDPVDEAQVEVQLAHVDGSYRWFEVRARDLSRDPEIQGTVLTAREISDRKTSERQLAESEARFRALVQSSSDIVAVVDGTGCFTYISPAVTEVLGFMPDELIGGPAMALMHPSDIAEFRVTYPELARRRNPDDDFSTSSFEVRIPHRSGEHRTLDITVSDMRHDPSVDGLVLNARDVTVRKALEADLRFQALHDSLTGLANRTRFNQETAHALRTSSAIGTVGALFIDLDDFKTVNDSLGHAVGDQLLQEVASRLLTVLPADHLVARLGGDEFAVLVGAADDDEAVLNLAEQVLDLVAQPYLVQGREIRVTASIGIAFASDETVDAEVLLRNADVAMYLAKDGGKGRYEVFEAHMHASVFERLELKADLAQAIDDGQLRCFYQPIVSLQTGRITGVEALVRWIHPTRGFLRPDGFIPLAEESGLIVPLGRWVLREACQQLRTWQLRLPPAASLTMSVNLSVRQLVHETIVDDVRAAVADANLDPSTVTLEITETTLMHDTDLTRRRLAQLREIGVSLAVDDFGTGYSSLQYVQRFPIDVIKIDRSFVVGLGTNPGDGAVVQSMIELAQRLGVHTVAEGIDRPEQVTLLQSLGADLGQGFLFSEPLPAPEFDRLLDANPHDAPRVQLQ